MNERMIAKIKTIYPNKKNIALIFIIDLILLTITDKILHTPQNLLPLIFIIIVIFISAVLVILKNPNIGILITLAIMPLERIGGFYFHSIHIRFDQLIIGISALVFLISALIHKNLKIKKDMTFILMLALIGVNILSLINAINITRETEVLLFTLIAFIIYYLFTANFFKIEYLKYVPYVIFTSSILLSLFGLYQYIGNYIGIPGSLVGLSAPYVKDVLGYPRIQSTEVEPLYWGNYLIFSITLSIAIITFRKKYKATNNLLKLALISFILSSINLVFTYARGAWIGEGIAIIVFLLLYIYIKKINKKIVLSAIGVLIILIIGFFTLLKTNHLPSSIKNVVTRAENLSSPDRIYLDTNSIEAFIRHPLIGIGDGGFGPFMSQNPFVMPPQNYTQIEGFGWAIVNNEYLSILTNTGILGFVLFAIFMFTLLIRSFKAIRKKINNIDQETIILIASLSSMIGMFAQYATFSVIYILQIWMVIVIVSITSYNILHVKRS